MKKPFKEYPKLNLSQTNKDILAYWKEHEIFEKSLDLRKDAPTFIFYEGPPSANGIPGIHHVLSRSIKDIFCRYKTQKGFFVERKAGWDTHGLPVELGVEKKFGITKEDIGTKVSVDEYNAECRSEVMKYKGLWEDLTEKMGYWVNTDDPYITFDSRYIESLWHLLKQLYDRGFLYKGYTIQPYSPGAGTGLSTHELNQPGCYKDVKDTTSVALFKMIHTEQSNKVLGDNPETYFMAWTTTPWTLPSNTALAVGKQIKYVQVSSFNPYTGSPAKLVLAEDLLGKHFKTEGAEAPMSYSVGDKVLPYRIEKIVKGEELLGIVYQQLMPWVSPKGEVFKIIAGDFVTTQDGTGIVHIAPTFGADDGRAAKESGISSLFLVDKEGKDQPMVDRTGKFFKMEDLDPDFVDQYINKDLYKEYEGRYVKNAFDDSLTDDKVTLDIDLSVMLKKEGLAFKVEKYEHSYPHCWRTDKPVLYYPLDSWFIKTTAVRDRMIELNKTINWKPESTGTGRFGKWLENLQDWNLSRSRYWGTPLPIWRTEDSSEEKCIGSVEELMREINRSVELNLMESNPYEDFVVGDLSPENYTQIDLHRPYVDNIILASKEGKPMKRELDLIDVWFDSGAMPYAQNHYPFSKEKELNKVFPADFIAEGVDQTRGWFFTLHAISVMLFDSVAYKNIISNGLVLDSNGNKMSKRLGNGVDPFEVIDKHGTDPLRWYMITNAQPWDNLKFDLKGVEEIQRKFFGTIYNTYSFLSLYANVDGFSYAEEEIPLAERPRIDRWIISLLNSLIAEVESHYENYEPTRAGRAIQEFVTENLSNWYVRLNRKRFWGGEYEKDKIAAYQTLYTCLSVVARLSAPIAPFFMDQLFIDLQKASKKEVVSVHLEDFPEANHAHIDKELEEQMSLAQQVTSLVLGLRRKVNLKVRQPLARIMVPISSDKFKEQLDKVKELVLAEVNVKELEYVESNSGLLVKNIKPNYKVLGPKVGKKMKLIADSLSALEQADILRMEQSGSLSIEVAGEYIELSQEDVTIAFEDIEGWHVAVEGGVTVALDAALTPELIKEGMSREFINRIQNIRKELGFDVTDRIQISYKTHKGEVFPIAVKENYDYIAAQVLASSINCKDELPEGEHFDVELSDKEQIAIVITKE